MFDGIELRWSNFAPPETAAYAALPGLLLLRRSYPLHPAPAGSEGGSYQGVNSLGNSPPGRVAPNLIYGYNLPLWDLGPLGTSERVKCIHSPRFLKECSARTRSNWDGHNLLWAFEENAACGGYHQFACCWRRPAFFQTLALSPSGIRFPPRILLVLRGCAFGSSQGRRSQAKQLLSFRRTPVTGCVEVNRATLFEHGGV